MPIPMRPNALNALAAQQTPTNAPPPAAYPGDDLGPMRSPQGGNALMRPPQQQAPSRGRVDPSLLSDLPPEFVEALMELGQLIDLDQDGTPDIAVVPLHGNAMPNALMGPPSTQR